jgi:outer membrane biosynthesis protein TonB
MAALKWAVVGICSLGALGALAMGFLEGGARGGAPKAELVALAMRPLPAMPGGLSAPTEPAAKPAEPAAKPAEPAAKPAEPAPKPAEPAPKPAEPAAKPAEPVAKPAEPVAKPAEPVAKPAEPAPKPAEPSPKPVAAKPPPPAAAPAGDGVLNMRASDTADVYVDGKKVGGSPLTGFKAKAGSHRVRFDCYDAAGNAIAGPVKTVTVKADEEQEVDFTCPEPE